MARLMVRPKIVATLGPASQTKTTIRRLVEAGADVFRLNLSHGTWETHAETLAAVRAVSEAKRRPLAVMADLCGPKIRIGSIRDGSVLLAKGAEVTIGRKRMIGDARRLSTTVPELIDAAKVGQRIRLDDGKIELVVRKRSGRTGLVCEVIVGGVLASGKGVNLPQTTLKLSAMTEKDRADARWLAKQDIDYVALSFVQRPADVVELRKVLTAAGSEARIIAKIEKPQAVKNIEGILAEADGIMVARGDLGVEMSLPKVPVAQKQLVRHATETGKICIVATQMLESMIESPTPTRAEVSDVANAVLDGADAVMLSAETAVGRHPHRAVSVMDRVVEQADGYAQRIRRRHGATAQEAGLAVPSATVCRDVSEDLQAMAWAVRALVTHQKIKAVAALTISGTTAVVLSKMRLPVPVLALTPSRRVVQQACMLYGVTGAEAPLCEHTRDVLTAAAAEVRRLRWASKGDRIVVVSGRPLRKSGTINTLVVHTL